MDSFLSINDLILFFSSFFHVHRVIWGFQSDWHATSTWWALTGLWLVPGEVKEEGLMLSKDVWRGGGEKKVRQINNGILSGLCSLSLSFSLSYSSCSGPLQLSQADFIAEPWKVFKTGKRWQDQPIYVCIILNKWFTRKCVSNLLWSNKCTYQLCCWTKKLVPPCLCSNQKA